MSLLEPTWKNDIQPKSKSKSTGMWFFEASFPKQQMNKFGCVYQSLTSMKDASLSNFEYNSFKMLKIQNENDLDYVLTIQEPVVVIKINDEEHLIYRSNLMAQDKVYEIIWKNERYALVKTESVIEILKFHSL